MSINKYNPTTGSLEAISQGRVWVGTKAEWEATVQSGSYPKNVLVAITDDEQGPVDVVEEDNPNAVSSGGVYDACTLKFSSGNYVGVDQLAYDATNKRLGLKVGGADTVIPFNSLPIYEWGLHYVYPPNNSGIYAMSGAVVNAETFNYSSTGTKLNNDYITIVNNNSHSFTFTFKKLTYVVSNNATLNGWHDPNTSLTITSFFTAGALGLVFG